MLTRTPLSMGQAERLFHSCAVYIDGPGDVMPVSTARELLGAAACTEQEYQWIPLSKAQEILAESGEAKLTCRLSDDKDYSLAYLTYSGFMKAVSYFNIMAAGSEVEADG